MSAKEGCSVIRQCENLENVFLSLFWCNNTGPINTKGFPVFFELNLNSCTQSLLIKSYLWIHWQNSEGFVQMCSNSCSYRSFACTTKKSGCMQHSRINFSWSEFSSSHRARSSNIQILSSFTTVFSILPTFWLGIDRLALHISWGLRGIWPILLTCETSPKELYTSSKTYFGNLPLSSDDFILSIVLGKVLRYGSFLLLLPLI